MLLTDQTSILYICNSIGHGPFSHVWDGCVLPKIRKKYPELKLELWKVCT